MIQMTRLKRLVLLGTCLLTNLGFLMMPILVLDSGKLAMMIGLVAATMVTFALLMFLPRFSFEKPIYGMAGSLVAGIIVGIVVYITSRNSVLLSLDWLNSYGKVILVALNLSTGLLLYFTRNATHRNSIPETSD